MHGTPAFHQRRDDVLIKRFANRAGLLGAIQHRDAADRRGQRLDEGLHGERPIEPHLEQPHFLATLEQRPQRLLGRTHAGPHHDHHALRVRCTHVVKQVVLATHELGIPVHVLLDDLRHRIVERIGRLPRLEEHVRVLGRAAQHRLVRVHRPLPELVNVLLIDHRPNVFGIEHLDLVHFVRRAKSVEEVQERHAGLERGGVRDHRQIVNLLHRIGRPTWPTRNCAVDITSLWSPKIDNACVANVRAEM